MMYIKKYRPAFSMVTAIFVILLLATVGAFIMNLSGKVVQETTAQYRKEQAILLAKSYTEFAIMAASSQDCVRRIQANVDGNAVQVQQGQGYRVDVQIQYIGDPAISPAACNNNIPRGDITGDSLDNIVIIDTYVRYRDPENIAARRNLGWTVDPGISYHKRTLQKL